MDLQSAQVADQSRLLSMPLEVLLQISSYLTTPEYGNLRGTCKHIEASLFNPFAKEFFAKRQFMITEFSLRALVDISKSRFAPSLTHLIIGLERPSTRALRDSAFFLNHYSEYERAIKQNRFSKEYVSHQDLVDTGYDLELLTEAFRNLPRLETVGIRDFNSKGRYRDGPDCTWHNYGSPTFYNETSVRLERPRRGLGIDIDGQNSQFVCHVFQAVLRALGNTNGIQPTPTRFEVILRNCGLPDRAFSLPRRLEASISPVLANLKGLFLDLDTTLPEVKVGDENNVRSWPGFLLSLFLLKTPSLEHLRLNFPGWMPTEPSELLSWLSKKPSASSPTQTADTGKDESNLPTPPSPAEFPNLKQLDVGMSTVHPYVLLDLYKRYKSTLRTVSLHKVTLIAPANLSRDKVNHWSKLCSQMAKLDLSLSSINISFVSQEHGGALGTRQVKFKEGTDSLVKRWAGSDLSHALKDYIDSMYIIWPQDPDTDDDEDDEDDDEDDDDDDVDGEDDASMDSDSDISNDPLVVGAPLTVNQVMAVAFGNDQDI